MIKLQRRTSAWSNNSHLVMLSFHRWNGYARILKNKCRRDACKLATIRFHLNLPTSTALGKTSMVTKHSDQDVGGKAASEWRKKRKLLMECDGMCLYHVIEGGGVEMGCTVCVPRSRNCCDRLWGSDS